LKQRQEVHLAVCEAAGGAMRRQPGDQCFRPDQKHREHEDGGSRAPLFRARAAMRSIHIHNIARPETRAIAIGQLAVVAA
jgi:hypothetical protein